MAGSGIIAGCFVAASLLDVLISVMYLRFYTTAAFIALFAVGGIFAAVISYFKCVSLAPAKTEFTRWSIIAMLLIMGLVFSWPLALLEGGEYGWAFRSFGIAMALSSLIFSKGKVDF